LRRAAELDDHSGINLAPAEALTSTLKLSFAPIEKGLEPPMLKSTAKMSLSVGGIGWVDPRRSRQLSNAIATKPKRMSVFSNSMMLLI
jgi:hypothetical protein